MAVALEPPLSGRTIMIVLQHVAYRKLLLLKGFEFPPPPPTLPLEGAP